MSSRIRKSDKQNWLIGPCFYKFNAEVSKLLDIHAHDEILCISTLLMTCTNLALNFLYQQGVMRNEPRWWKFLCGRWFLAYIMVKQLIIFPRKIWSVMHEVIKTWSWLYKLKNQNILYIKWSLYCSVYQCRLDINLYCSV